MVRVTPKTAGLVRLRARIAALPSAAVEGARAGLQEVAAGAAEEVRRGLGEAQASAVAAEPADGAGALLLIDLPDAEAREFGTARTAARPLLRPAAARAAAGAAGVLAAHLVQAVKRMEP